MVVSQIKPKEVPKPAPAPVQPTVDDSIQPVDLNPVIAKLTKLKISDERDNKNSEWIYLNDDGEVEEDVYVDVSGMEGSAPDSETYQVKKVECEICRTPSQGLSKWCSLCGSLLTGPPLVRQES